MKYKLYHQIRSLFNETSKPHFVVVIRFEFDDMIIHSFYFLGRQEKPNGGSSNCPKIISKSIISSEPLTQKQHRITK